MELTQDQALQKGVEAHKAGKTQLAGRYYTAILKANPKHPDANHNMGILTVGIGKVEAALPFLKTALESNPKTGQFWLSYINALIKLNRLDDAKVVFDQAKNKGAKGDGFAHIEEILDDPDQGQLKSLMRLYDKNEFQQVFNTAQKLAKKYTKSLEIWNLMGASAVKIGHQEAALLAFQKALSIKPDYFQAYTNIGIVLKEQGKLEESIKAYKKALSIKADHSETYNNMGNALTDQGKLDEALEAYANAISIKPDYADAHVNMGVTLHEQGKLKEAIASYGKALHHKPDHAEAHQNLSYVLLSRGELKQGLDEYEWRWEKAKAQLQKRSFSQPLWDGQHRLEGKRLLIWCEQGVGDTINWSSKLPFISSVTDHCILECQEKLVPLLTRSFPNVEVKPEDRGQDSHRDDFDYHLPTGSLYRHCIPEICKNIIFDAFLVPDPTRVNFWQERLKSIGSGPYIGVSWKSSDISLTRFKNYAPIAEWSPIFNIPEVTFINLQYKDFLGDLTKIQNLFGVTVHNFDDLDQYDNLDDVAALCAALDIVVSTKTTVPLISAGVGTLTMLANWRQSPWNNILMNPVGPLIDIFEKNTWETWESVLSKIADSIIKVTKK